jgi:alpha-1,6-mannosyltransferase
MLVAFARSAMNYTRSTGEATLAATFGCGYVLLLVCTGLIERRFHESAAHASLARGSALVLLLCDAIAWLAAGALYALLLATLGERGLSSRLRAFFLAAPVVAMVILAPIPPLLSTDLLSYVGHGRLGATGGNPYLTPVRDLAGSSFGHALARFGWHPEHGVTPYGPLWTDIEAAALHLVHRVYPALLLLKSVVVLSAIGTGAALWWLLRDEPRTLRLAATAAFLWNPLVLVQVAREGHNDALMAFLTVLSLALLHTRRAFPSGIALALAVATKFVPLLLVVPMLVYIWRRERRLLARFASGLVCGAVLMVALYEPFWAGSATFDGLRTAGHIGENVSTAGAVWVVLSHIVSDRAASAAAGALVDLLLVAVVIAVSRPIRTFGELKVACAVIALVYALVATPVYWPWYSLLSVALLASIANRLAWTALVVLSTCGLVAAPLDDLRHGGVISTNAFFLVGTIVAVFVPIVVIVVGSRRQAFAWLSPARPTTGVGADGF